MNRPDASAAPIIRLRVAPGGARQPRLVRAALALAAAGLLVAAVDLAHAQPRCSIDLQRNVCLEANPNCPPVSGPLGIASGSWPVFQQNAQHTGKSPFAGPTCSNVLWTTKLQGKMLSAPALVPPAPGQPESLFVPVGKAPICALDPTNGSVRYCGTDNLGKLVDRSSPVVGNDGFLYVGTRDNDLWAIEVGEGPGKPPVAWRQKVCTDGDITTSPTIAPDGTIFMGSDSLGAGTLMAMCPGAERQVRWCINPAGGGVRNTSPALSPSGDRIYVTIGAGALGAFNPATGQELWRVQLQKKSSTNRAPNYTPVVHPVAGVIYLGTKSGIWEITPQANGATTRLLYSTREVKEKVFSPPALDVERSTLVFGASRGVESTLYAIGLDGSLKWKRSALKGAFKNLPPVIDNAGRIYFALRGELTALDPNGNVLWQITGAWRFDSSPILGNGTLYIGTTNAIVMAIGGC